MTTNFNYLLLLLVLSSQSYDLLASEYNEIIQEIKDIGFKLACNHYIKKDQFLVYLKDKSIYRVTKTDITNLKKERIYREFSWKFLDKNNNKMYQEGPEKEIFYGFANENDKYYATSINKVVFFTLCKKTVSVNLKMSSREGTKNDYKEVCKITIDEIKQPMFTPEELQGKIIERRVSTPNDDSCDS